MLCAEFGGSISVEAITGFIDNGGNVLVAGSPSLGKSSSCVQITEDRQLLKWDVLACCQPCCWQEYLLSYITFQQYLIYSMQTLSMCHTLRQEHNVLRFNWTGAASSIP